MKKGLVVKNVSGRVEVFEGNKIFVCTVRGKIKNQNERVLVGDFCMFDEVALSIESILPRKNQLVRPPVANVDQIFIFVSSVPQPDRLLIDKLIISARKKEIDVVLVVAKKDIIDGDFVREIEDEYGNVVTDIVLTSSLNHEGIEHFRSMLLENFSVFVGQSGVGKSSLLNLIVPDANQEVGDVSHKDERGKNTTRSSQIFFHESGAIIDSPGFNLFNIFDIKSCELRNFYPDFEPYSNECKYRSCDHINADEDICGVKQALKIGQINMNRYNRYREIFTSIKGEEEKKYVKNSSNFTKYSRNKL